MRASRLVARLLAGVLLTACDKAAVSEANPPEAAGSTRAAVAAPTAAPTAVGSAGTADLHDLHDCSRAHPDEPRPPLSTATALTADARAQADTLRISERASGVILRKDKGRWVMGGRPDCAVRQDRVERALVALARIKAESTSARPSDFDLQIVVQRDEERLLHFEVADRVGDTELVQLSDGSSFRVRGLDRELLSANPGAWCDPARARR